MVEGYDYEDVPQDLSVAERKAQEAKAAETLNPVERFVASGTEINFNLFEKALEEATEQARSCYGDDWIPTGDAAELMVRMDHAKNFLALAETYFTALARPLMQAAQIHIQHVQMAETFAPKEPSALQRAFKSGARVLFVGKCSMAYSGMQGTIMESMDEDGDILVKADNGNVEYHTADCLELVK